MITHIKCKGDGCPIKVKCFRYTSEPDEDWQSYFERTPGEYLVNKMWMCKHYVDLESYSIVNRIDEELT